MLELIPIIKAQTLNKEIISLKISEFHTLLIFRDLDIVSDLTFKYVNASKFVI